MAYRGRVERMIVPKETDLDAAVADTWEWAPLYPIMVHKCTFIYSEATDAAIATPGVVSLDHTPSGAARVEKATYTAEVSQSIGTEKELTTLVPFAVATGDKLHFEHKTQQTATEVGQGYFMLYYEPITDHNIG